MRIGLDASLAIGQKVGVGYYVTNLIKALAELDKENHYLLYPFFGITFNPNLKTLASPATSSFEVYMKSTPKYFMQRKRKKLGIDNPYYFENIDVLHSTTFFVPKKFNGKVISTIYDLSFILFPEYHTEANRLYCLQGVLDSVLRCNKIIAISHNTKKDLIEYFNVDPNKITVTPLAPSKIFKPLKDKDRKKSVLQKYGITEPYIFSLGSIEPRKNLIRLIRAYNQLSPSIKQEFSLVLSGGKGWLNCDIYSEVETCKLQNNVKFTGYIEIDDLPVLYSSASVFVYPSLYEGFGLPVIEAMACGTPVITSNNSSLKEVAEGVAVLINPLDISEISDSIQAVLNDSGLRSRISFDGLARASEFSWLKTAEQTLKVYQAFSL